MTSPKKGAKAWHPGTVSAILNNEINAGTWSFGKHAGIEPKNPRPSTKPGRKNSKEARPRSEWLSVSVPAIVSQELYDTVRAQLDRNKAMSPRNSKNQYLFRGLLICARCGYRMYGYTRPSGASSLYHCPGRTMRHIYTTMGKRCDQQSISLRRIEAVVWDEVVRQLSDEKELRKRLEEREAELKRGRKDDEAELEILINLELGLKRQANKDLDLYDSDIIDKETLRERMAVTREMQEALARSKAEVTARLVQWSRARSMKSVSKNFARLHAKGCRISRLRSGGASLRA